MTYYDAAMIGIVIAGMVWGAIRGITWQVASIASLVLGYTLAHTLSGPLSSHFPGEPVVARSLAMLAIYAAVSGGVFLIAWIVRTTLRKLKFEAYDRHLGMLLGGLEGAMIGLVATLFVVSLAPSTRAPIFSSPTGKVVSQVMATIGPVLPPEARNALAPFLTGTPSEASVAEQPVEESAGDTHAIPPLFAEGTPPGGTAATVPPPSSLKQVVQEGEQQINQAIGGTASNSPPLDEAVRQSGKRISQAIGGSATNPPQSLNEAVRQSGKRIGQVIGESVTKNAPTLDEVIQEGQQRLGQAIQENATKASPKLGRIVQQGKQQIGEVIGGKDGQTPRSLSQIIEEGEQRIGQAIGDRATKALRQAVNSGDANGGSGGGAAQRR